MRVPKTEMVCLVICIAKVEFILVICIAKVEFSKQDAYFRFFDNHYQSHTLYKSQQVVL